MNIALYLYLADLCNSIKIIGFICVAITGILVIIGFFMFAAAVDNDDEEFTTGLIKVARTKLKLILISAIIETLILCVIPSGNTVYLMVGATATQELSVSETGQKVMKAINVKLDEIISKSEQRQSE